MVPEPPADTGRAAGVEGCELPLLSLAGFSARHGFTTRVGGVSNAAYQALNLGLSTADEPATVEANRDRLLARLGVDRSQVCGYHQVHGVAVKVASPGWFEERADASVSDDPNLLLVVSAADCFPVLFHDPVTGAAAAAHCGWRGTVGHLAAAVVEELQERFGAAPNDLEVAIGQGIMGTCYEVSQQVVDEFAAAGFPDSVATPTDDSGRHLLDILAAIRFDLERAGVAAANVHALERCTHCEPEAFYSHRRDAGITGRMWGFVSASSPNH